MLTSEQIERLLPAFEGIETEEGYLPATLLHDLPTGLVCLTQEEVEAVANRILELQTIVAQNALVRDGDYPTSTGRSE